MKESQHRSSVFSRISKTLAKCVAIAVSLLSFPSVTPLMFAGWLIWYTVHLSRNQWRLFPLIACVVILLVKTLPWFPSVILLAVSLVSVVGVTWYVRSNPPVGNQLAFPAVLLLWCSWGAFAYQWHDAAERGQLSETDFTRPVVCVGDSLTQGMIPDPGYPGSLAKLIRRPVVNLGFSGITVGQGHAMIDRVLKHRPEIVVIELGGHDFLKGHDRATTKDHLVAMIQRCRDANAEPILMEIPRGFMIDPFRRLEREIAYEMDVQLVADSWLRQIVLMSPVAPPGMWMPEYQLSDDGIHSNSAGSQAIARRVVAAITALDGPGVLVRD